MLEQIARDREVAREVIKPTDAELQHGLELHNESIVIDTYGFTPTVGFEVDDMVRHINDGADYYLDLEHFSDRSTQTIWTWSERHRKEALQAWKESGVDCIFVNAGQEEETPDKIMLRHSHRTFAMDALRPDLTRAAFPEDIIAAKRDGKKCMVLTTNCVPLQMDTRTPYQMLNLIESFFLNGTRMMHLTYNRRNLLGDGCGEADNAGLSDFGKAAIAEMNRCGVIVDVAHSGWKTSLEAAKASSRPIVASHSGCVAINDHIRMKPDDTIKAIAESGGLLGVVAFPSFVGASKDINGLLDHIDYLAKLVGTDHIGIGTDLGYFSPLNRESQEAFNNSGAKTGKNREHYRSLWPEGSTPAANEWELMDKGGLKWSNWPMFTVGLVKRGYSDEDIKKIIGGNMLRVFGDNIPEKYSDLPARKL